MAAELDGRNGTDEILCSGYSGRVHLLSREPGYGLRGVAANRTRTAASPDMTGKEKPAESGTGGEADSRREDTLRIAIAPVRTAADALSPLSYGGGFETKSLVYETLMRRDRDGRITPSLAKSFEIDPDGRTFRLALREDAVFHDGTRVTPEAVCQHFRRWVRLPEHGWLPSARFIESFRPAGPGWIEIRLDRPWSLLSDLCAINPAAVRAPGSLDRQGAFQGPVGSGPFRFASMSDDGSRLTYRRTRSDAPQPPSLELLPHAPAPAEILRKIRERELDAAVNGWYEVVPVEMIPDIPGDPALRVVSGPGSSVAYLSFGTWNGADITLANRFLPGPGHPSAAEDRYRGVPARLRELVEATLSGPDEARRALLYVPVQRMIEEEALVIPLLVPGRVAVLGAHVAPPSLDHDLYRLP